MATAVQHHHRSTTKTLNKPFKSRHTSKSALKNQAKGKVELLETGSRRTPHQQVMSKLDRRNQAKQRRLNTQSEREDKVSIFTGRNGAPRVVAVVPLCGDVVSEDVQRILNASVDVDEGAAQSAQTIEIPRFKQRVQYLLPARELLQCLDACRVADYVLFVLSAQEEVDQVGEHLLRCIESQGVSTVLTAAYGLERVEPAKRRPDVAKSLKSFITHFFATQEKVHDLSNRQECSNVMRSLCTTVPKGIQWREDRSWMHVESCRWQDGEVVMTGVVRGRGWKVDRLVHAGDWGDFQLEKITAAPLEVKQKRGKVDDMSVDVAAVHDALAMPSEEQEALVDLAPEEVVMDDLPTASLAPSERKGILLDDHHYFKEDVDEQFVRPKRLPKGTSDYQAAWYLGDMSDSGSDLEDNDDEDEVAELGSAAAAGPADGEFDETMRDPTEAAPSEYPQSEAFLDPAPEDETEQLEAYRQQRREEAEEDLEFPDEIELHPHVSARERLAKYRGLKSLRTSAWETSEDKPYEPEDWNRLLEIADYKSAKNRILKEAMTGGVKPGTRVDLHLRVTTERRSELAALRQPLALFSLLKHEYKRTATNVSISLSSEYPAPLRSKEPLIMQCGPRRFLISPLYSQPGNTPNNVHKFDRYLHPGRTAVASFTAPVTWGSVPCLFFQRPAQAQSADAVEDLANALDTQDQPTPLLSLIATGTTLPPSSNRVIAKRVILTGHPYKIHKKLVTVRYMFFNADDVEYFRALQLWTKRGRSGFIKEALGTHGYFKATFDAKINPLDAVAVSLYKRVWPRPALPWRSDEQRGREVAAVGNDEAPKLMEVE